MFNNFCLLTIGRIKNFQIINTSEFQIHNTQLNNLFSILNLIQVVSFLFTTLRVSLNRPDDLGDIPSSPKFDKWFLAR
jgi:hypothetical protein